MSDRRGVPPWLLVGGAVVLGIALVVAGRGGPTVDHTLEIAWWQGEDPGCPNPLTPEHVDAGIGLATTWLVADQTPQGTFVDARDPATGSPLEQLDLVRQATATWALARANAATPADPTRQAALRSLDFWRSRSSPAGVPLVPGTDRAPSTGVAILALAAAELLADPELPPDDRVRVHAVRDALLGLLVAARTPSGRIADEILAHGTALGVPTPPADSATFAALVRAGGDDRPDLAEPAVRLGRAIWSHHVEAPRKQRRDPAPTRELFPWAPLAYRDLAATGWLDTEDAGPALAELGVWMVDDHQTLRRSGNIGYAASAVTAAAGWARGAEDARAAKLQCVSDRMLARLLGMQVGHPLATGPAAGVPPSPQLTGAVVAGVSDGRVRVDYAAHVLVALLEWREAR